MTTMTATRKARIYPLAENAPMVKITEASRAHNYYLGSNPNFDPASIQVFYSGKFDINMAESRFDDFFDALNTIWAKGIKKYGRDMHKNHGGKIDEEVLEAIWEHIYKKLVVPGYLTVADLSSPAFQRWLMNVAHGGDYAKFLAWRHGKNGSAANWGIGKFNPKVAHFSRLLFFRLHFVYHKTTAGQTLAFGKGTSDFWRSGITGRQVRGRTRIQAKTDFVRNNSVNTKDERQFSKAETIWSSNHRMDHLSKADSDAVIGDIYADRQRLNLNR